MSDRRQYVPALLERWDRRVLDFAVVDLDGPTGELIGDCPGVGQGTGQAVEPGDYQGFPGSVRGQRLTQAGTLAVGSGQAVGDVNPLGFDTPAEKYVALDGQVLLVGGASGVPNKQAWWSRARLSEPVLDRLLDLEPGTRDAVAAVDEVGIVGVARYVRDPDNDNVAEVAVLVVDEWQGRGVGRSLLQALTARALDAGVTTFRADVLAENARARRLLAGLAQIVSASTSAGHLLVTLDVTGRGS